VIKLIDWLDDHPWMITAMLVIGLILVVAEA